MLNKSIMQSFNTFPYMENFCHEMFLKNIYIYFFIYSDPHWTFFFFFFLHWHEWEKKKEMKRDPLRERENEMTTGDSLADRREDHHVDHWFEAGGMWKVWQRLHMSTGATAWAFTIYEEKKHLRILEEKDWERRKSVRETEKNRGPYRFQIVPCTRQSSLDPDSRHH